MNERTSNHSRQRSWAANFTNYLHMKNGKDDFALILAWPDTKCKQVGAWYDSWMRICKFNKNGYYRVGHAAIVLVSRSSNTAHYFDFGRYITPDGYGRVRCEKTDHNLKIKTNVQFSNTGIKNIDELLGEIERNKACHGDGALKTALLPVNFDAAHQEVQKLKAKEFVPYGPFTPKGTNCSRFVRQIAMKACTVRRREWLLRSYSLSPTPYGIVKLLGEYRWKRKSSFTELKSLKRPVDTKGILQNKNYLGGIGAGAYFIISPTNASNYFNIQRYDNYGVLESDGVYSLEDANFDLNEEYQLIYPSNSHKVTIVQHEKLIVLNFVSQLMDQNEQQIDGLAAINRFYAVVG